MCTLAAVYTALSAERTQYVSSKGCSVEADGHSHALEKKRYKEQMHLILAVFGLPVAFLVVTRGRQFETKRFGQWMPDAAWSLPM